MLYCKHAQVENLFIENMDKHLDKHLFFACFI